MKPSRESTTKAPAATKPKVHKQVATHPAKRRKLSPDPIPTKESKKTVPEPGSESKSESEPEVEEEEHESDVEDAGSEIAIPAQTSEVPKTFAELGVHEGILDSCKALGYKFATPIQAATLPPALEGRDVIGVAETGSGKTAAFAIPILQSLLSKARPFHTLVLAPTRELALQIGKTFDALGGIINAKCCVIVGGVNMVDQMVSLAKKPHVIVATPGRLRDHLEKTKGFSLHRLEYLVLDEADKLLDLDFGPVIEKILAKLPRERKTYLFSATMSTKVESLQRAALKSPVKLSVNAPDQHTTKNLTQQVWVIPQMHKDVCLVYLMNNFAGKSIIIFVRTFRECQRVAILLRQLGFGAVPLYGKLPMSARVAVLNKFREKSRDILVATDVAARGLDVPAVDLVVNFDLPMDSKTYVHRVGRTARAGRAGTAINCCTQYDIEVFLRIEHFLGYKMDVYEDHDEELLKPLMPRVEDAQRAAKREVKEMERDKKDRKRNKGKRYRDDRGEEEG
ncbi:P-loop containing nucleoside triphosphate hydrolase protein [Zalerion maritima]|uniref:P-loop containing nucleoside triphosphate hydrolase protein n=1 Tax=Zalerion maritima TaxID=339359 RepID=A0AAD5RNW1_9PEZI|nr:P-loop containing nucleoside triphosphate hydrolase protein [Zalerion maritima]